MCGIGGIFIGEGQADLASLSTLFEGLSDRGKHACGFSYRWNDSDKDLVWKAAISSIEAVKQGILASKIGSNLSYALLHTRYTTQGSTAYNGNNHPITGHNIILTHNGVISNDDRIFQTLGVNRLHQVDSECLNAALSHESPSWLIDNIHGAASIAWVDITQNQHEVHLLTNGRNPLVIGRTVEGHVVWASNKYHLEDSFNLAATFNAIPFKQYTISKGAGEPMITSKFISNKRADPRVIGRFSHVASYGDVCPSSRATPTKKQKKPKKTTSKAKKGNKFIHAGFVYDEDLKCWRKARITDWK